MCALSWRLGWHQAQKPRPARLLLGSSTLVPVVQPIEPTPFVASRASRLEIPVDYEMLLLQILFNPPSDHADAKTG